MPKVRSRGRASRASTGGPTRASPRASVRASSVAAQRVPASSSRISRAPSSVQAPDGVAVPSQETPSIPRPQQQSQPEALLSPAFIETLITKVADEVSRRLSPAENSSSQPPTAPSNLTEVPRLSTDGLPPTTPSTLQEIPVDSTGGQSSQVPADLIATRVVQGSLATVSNAVTGLLPSTSEGPPPLPGQCFQSVGLPVDARVSEKLREKIWKDEFIDFGSLLVNPVLANRFQLTFQNDESGPLPSLCVEPISKSKKITSIESWLSSFHIFVGVYAKRFPHEAPALMKYCETIQDLAGRGHNWKFYDENFRFLRQANRSALPWDQIHNELWLKSHQVTPPRSLQQAFTGRLAGKVDTTPKGYCFRFHKGRKCFPGCAYKHLCYKCEGSHPVSKCNFRGPAKTSGFQPQPAKSQSSQPANSSKS